jgi:hypothetical protein
MKIYFSTNEKWYSKLMRFAEGSDVTHVGLGFFDDLQLVIDCTIPKGSLYHYWYWADKYEVVHTLDIPMSKEDEELAYKLTLEMCLLAEYDRDAYIFGLYWLLRHKITGERYPNRNLGNRGNKLMCSEIFVPVVGVLKKYGIDLECIDFSVKSPRMLYDIIESEMRDIRLWR